MKMHPGFQRYRHKKGLFAASGLLLLLATHTVAQSGRRAPKPDPAPVPTPQTDTEATPKSSARDLKRRVSLLVGSEPSSKHLLSEDAIFEHVLNQLRQFKNVTTTSLGDIKRDRAVKRAKTGKNKFEGKVYYKAVGGPILKKDNWPTGTAISLTTEAVGIEAAEQIRDWL